MKVKVQESEQSVAQLSEQMQGFMENLYDVDVKVNKATSQTEHKLTAFEGTVSKKLQEMHDNL